ncbi:MAG: hypothetical protein DMG98_15610, partial [Acidobacteria bacterium]
MSGKPANTRRKKRPISWQLQTAKARFSEVFRRARSEGPQYVTRAGKEAVVIVPAEQFEKLTARAPSLEAWLNSSVNPRFMES